MLEGGYRTRIARAPGHARVSDGTPHMCGTAKDIMHKRTKMLLTALVAVFACSFGAGGASASRSIEVRGGAGGVQAESQLTFFGTEQNRALEVTCDITLLRTVASIIPKTTGTLFGKLTAIRINRGGTTRSPACGHGSFIREVHDVVPLNCTHREAGGGVLVWDCTRAPAGLWKLRYRSFQGELPSINGINFWIQGTQFNLILLEPFGGTIECLYEGDSFGLITVTQPGSTITRAEAVTAATALARLRGSGLCPARGTFRGTFAVRPTLTIRLL